ncbi:MAG: hypothetical protein EKK63_13675 [Acinetobacter sp.]|uniref:hypothetical protein n=1 Tax=Acinetobacter sp. TaxID=472 RepID=UPI000F91CD24|nr:hypothetical protein [Acinetobacter sp.]RUP37951.1 MAG: hypothetical protein EKK63_13675 [Acinetobacter sp.]
MRNVTEDKIIGSFAVLGMATLLTALVAATITWIDPFLSFDNNGDPTIFGRMFVYGIYTAEALAGLLVLWMVWLAAWSFIPKRKPKNGQITHIPLEVAKNVTGRTHGVN